MSKKRPTIAVDMPGVEDKLLQLARDRMQFLEDDVAAGERLQPFGNDSADEHRGVGDSHHRQVNARRGAGHLPARHHHQHKCIAADSDDEDDRCAEDPQRAD